MIAILASIPIALCEQLQRGRKRMEPLAV